MLHIDFVLTAKLLLCHILDTIRLYFCLQVDPLCSVSAAHYIGENVRHQIHKLHPEVAEVFIHIGTLLGFTVFLNSSRQTT
jgi:divalent metal cation (Fe/Co/Zn/Cd) transporter